MMQTENPEPAQEVCCGADEDEVDLKSNSTFHSLPEYDPEVFSGGLPEFDEMGMVPDDFYYFDENNESVSEAQILNLKADLAGQQIENSELYFEKIRQPATEFEESKAPIKVKIRARGLTGWNDRNVFEDRQVNG